MLNSLALIIAACQITIGFGGPPCEGLQNAKKRTYGFRPTTLDPAQRAQKSSEMDEFWKFARQLGPTGVKCLTQLLSEEKDDGFFLFDGSTLLYTLDQSEATAVVVRDAVQRSNLADVEPSGFLRLALNLSKHGVDVGPLAVKYLTYPKKVDTYLPQHGAMQFNRLEGGMILFGSMPPAQADKYLMPLLSADNREVRETAALLLGFSMTEESFQALNSPAITQSLTTGTRKMLQDFTRYTPARPLANPKYSREEVLKIIRRIPHTNAEFEALQPEYIKSRAAQEAQYPKRQLTGKELSEQIRRDIEEGEPFFGISGAKRFEESAIQTLTESDLPELREARRKSIQGISDEALYEYSAFSRIILGIINRLDLYKEYRSH